MREGFFENMTDHSSILEALESVILERKQTPPAKPSYVVKLLNGGVPKIGAKILEEAAEVVEAAEESGSSGRAHLVGEASDLVFHTLVLLCAKGVSLRDVEEELGRRFGIGGIEEKESRARK